MIKPFSEDISTGDFREVELRLDSADWQKLREEIRRWKKAGGILRAKLKGEKDKTQHEKRIRELIAERGPKQTSEEEDEIYATPGIIPPWWGKGDGYYKGAIKAIKKLGVSALEVHLATERDYTDKPLTDSEKRILRVGWPEVKHSENIVPFGENYHRDVGWY